MRDENASEEKGADITATREGQKELEAVTKPYYQLLFDHMAQDHGLTLTGSELDDIVFMVERMQARRNQESQTTMKNYSAWLQLLRRHDETWRNNKFSLKERVRRCRLLHAEMCAVL